MQPGQATALLNDRIRLINKVNADVADWLQVRSFFLWGPNSIHEAVGADVLFFLWQERRRVEELYAQGLRKLATRPQLDNGSSLG